MIEVGAAKYTYLVVLFVCSNEQTKKAMYIDKSDSSSWIRRKVFVYKAVTD